MRSRARVRRAVKWGGLIVGVWLLAAWGFGDRYSERRGFKLGGFCVGIGFGSVLAAHGAEVDGSWACAGPTGRSLDVEVGAAGRPQWASGSVGSARYVVAVIPLWIPAVIFLAPAAILCGRDAVVYHRRVREGARRSRGLCGSCRYDRAGLTADAPCPECGHIAGV